ncbi:MAG: acyltransferase family protein [Candidatus Avilachnospira sp.]|jgi:fucose 4-O-acetylase-like acetyltransferase
MTDERYFRNKINLLSFALTIAVIWVHAFNVEYAGNLLTGINFFAPGQEALSAELRMTPEGEFAFFAACIENIFSELLGQGAVPGFFIISAYLFYRNIGPRLYPGKLIIKWKRRVRSLLIPYLLWNLLYFLLSFADSGGRLEVSAASLFDAIVNYRDNPVFWYMKQLIMLTVLAPFVFVALKNRNPARLFLLLSFLGAAFWTRIRYHIVNEDALFYYLLGAYFAMHLRQEAESEHESSLWLKRGVILSFSAVFLLIINYGIQDGTFFAVEPLFRSELVTGLTVLLRAALPMALFCFVSLGMGTYKKRSGREAALPESLNICFFVYATHYMVIKAVNRVVELLFTGPYLNAVFLMLFFLMPLICIGTALIISRMLKRTVPGFWSIINGGR